MSDFGAGSGWFARALSHAVGRTGKVYALEIQKPLVEHMAATAHENRLENVEVVWCDIEEKDGCKLRPGMLDAGVLADTLSQLDDKETALGEIRKLLRTGGKLLLLDWKTSRGKNADTQDVVPEEEAKQLVERHGFKLAWTFPAGEQHYGLAFRAI